MRPSKLACTAVAIVVCPLSACGGSASSSGAGSTNGGSPTSTAGGASALSAEARSLATGDIPDNQVFLTFHDRGSGYSLRYPEGWAQQGSGADVTFREKNNVIHVLVVRGPQPTPGSVTVALARERSALPSLSYGPATTASLAGGQAVKVSYSTLSPPNPVTGKRVKLLVDRYALAHGGKVATLDLATPQGVDNVDAYHMISHSFRWG
jgi:hypothetical protein